MAFCQHVGGVDPELVLAISDKTKMMLQSSRKVTDFRKPGASQPSPRDALSDLVSYTCHLAAEANLSRRETIQLFDVGGLLGPRLPKPSLTTKVTMQWLVPCTRACADRFTAAEGPLAARMLNHLMSEVGTNTLTLMQTKAIKLIFAEEWRCDERFRVHNRRGNINKATLRRRSDDELQQVERTLVENTTERKVYLMEATVARRVSWTVMVKPDQGPPGSRSDVIGQTVPHNTRPLTGFAVNYQSPAWKIVQYWGGQPSLDSGTN